MKKIALNFCVLLLIATIGRAQEDQVKIKKTPINKTVEFKLKNFNNISESVSKPKIYIDGKLFDFDISLINKDQIESIFIVKGEKAEEEYNSPNDVILINTKTNPDSKNNINNINDKTTNVKEKTTPLFFVDGDEASEKIIEELKPDDIESISVLKDAAATKLYGSRGENGIVIIKTKKRKQ